MAVLLIGYDLNREGANYSETNKKLTVHIKKQFPTHWHHLDSTWIVVTEMACVQVRDALRKLVDADDELLVVGLNGRAAWHGFNKSGADWLIKNMPKA